MTKIPREAGLRSDGELVQGGADTFVFAPTREDAVGLLLPAVQAVREAAVIDQSDIGGTASAHGDWIDILTMSPPPPTRAAQSGGDDDDDDGLPPTLDWGIDGDGPGDQGHGDWIDIITMSPPPPTRATQADDDHRGWIDIPSTGGGAAGILEENLPASLLWDIG